MTHTSRRTLMKTLCAAAACAGLGPAAARATARQAVTKTIPSSGESLFAIGMGTARTFDAAVRAGLAEVLQAFFDNGGQVIDSSPMYGAAEATVGELLGLVDDRGRLFAATKVWTDGRQAGIEQMRTSMQRMGVSRMDLMQIHNLRDWRTHLGTLRAWKEEGRIRYLGITTSHGRNHDELTDILRREPLDFVQFSYNIEDRAAERALLPVAAERGIATLVNRPFKRGSLFRRARGQRLPGWAADIDCATWAQVFLKYVVSHPAVTCAIPATSKVKHMADNMGAGRGRLPDAELRRRMAEDFARL